MSYLRSNPLAEHNSGIALSSKDVPQNGTGNMYDGQGGRAFVQGGGGMSGGAEPSDDLKILTEYGLQPGGIIAYIDMPTKKAFLEQLR